MPVNRIFYFWLKVDWLWLKQKPSPLRLLAQIIGRERLIELLQAGS